MRKYEIKVKRAYDPPAKEDGTRILVDRLWPRGVTKEKLKLDQWLKEVAPSSELRKAFHHDPAKWDHFKKEYLAELKENPEVVQSILEALKKGSVTLIYGARDTEHNHALILKNFLERKSEA